jgi:Ca2+/Na+ antiporter
MTEQFQLPLSFLAGAAACFYGATHLLWRGMGGHTPARPMLRGVVLGLPVVAVASYASLAGASAMGVSILLSGAVIFVTLILGIIAISNPYPSGTASPALRLLPPLAAATFVIGLSGELTITHAIALLSMTIVLLWSHPSETDEHAGPLDAPASAWAGALMVVGTIALGVAVSRLLTLPILPVIGPVIVPLTILGAIGLLVGDTHARASKQATDTVVATAITLIGIGLPLVILMAHLSAAVATSTTQPATQPADPVAAVVMPIQSWRIDTVLLTVVCLMLTPVGLGRFKLSRLDGLLLILACLAFLMITVSTARL